MKKITVILLAHCIIIPVYSMQKTLPRMACQSSDSTGSETTSSPTALFKLASDAYLEAIIARENEKSAQEIDACYTVVRWHLTTAFAQEAALREKGESEGCLLKDQYGFAQFWMAQLLAQGLGGKCNIALAKQLCQNLLKDTSVSPYCLKDFAETLLKKLNDESTQEPQ